MKKVIPILIVAVAIISYSLVKTRSNEAPKNIILLIGDGMGVTQLYAGMSTSENPLCIESFKNIGFHKTYSADDLVTDSGAGGTAIACGQKTNNKSVGVDKDGKPIHSILYYAEKNDLATGLVSTSAITHATPAAFMAHTPDRYSYEDIAYDFLATDIDVFIGGGFAHFTDREDGLNLADSLRKRNYTVTTSLEEVLAAETNKLAGFTAIKHNPAIHEGRNLDMLSKSVKKALEILEKYEDGFFLMVEGSQIDWGGHDNDFKYVVNEVVDFDKAVKVAKEFAESDGETLVIVTADHETGALSLFNDTSSTEIGYHFGSDHHTGVMVPVFAFGPGAEDFQGIYENTDLFKKMMKNLSLEYKKGDQAESVTY